MRTRFGWSAWLLAAVLLGGCGGGAGDEGLRALKSASWETTAAPADATHLRKAAAPIAGDLVFNGGFEQGEAGWTSQSSADYLLIGGFEAPPVTANTGAGMAWLGGDDRLSESVTQTITVPNAPGRFYVEFWYQVVTDERVEADYDVLEVVATPDGLTRDVLQRLSNVHRTKGWARAGPLDVTAYRGRTIQLRFESSTDSGWPTSFLIDDVSLYSVAPTPIVPSSGMWWNPAQPGRGFFIDQQGDKALLGAYMFEKDGRATWYAGQLTNPLPEFGLYQGDLLRHSGGQSLAGAWRAPNVKIEVPAAHLQFVSPTRGHLEGYTPDGYQIRIAIERFSITGGPIQPSAARFQSGMWWSESEGGRGYVVDVQGSTVLFGAFMYTEAGQPVWYVATAPLTSPDGFVAELQQMERGQTLRGGWYEPGSVPGRIGSIRFEASSATTATLTLPNGRPVAIRRVAS